MKTIKLLGLLFISTLVLTACSDDDDAPEPVNEEEVITTLIAVLTPSSGSGDTITLTSRDLDGDGPDAPVVTVSGPLAANVTYNGTVQVLNETESPAENITLEVLEEADEHQFFYIASSSLNLTTTYTDQDDDGNPLGVIFDMTTGDASSGTLNVVLRHEPLKPNDGTLAGAGGETDISVTFTVDIQ